MGAVNGEAEKLIVEELETEFAHLEIWSTFHFLHCPDMHMTRWL